VVHGVQISTTHSVVPVPRRVMSTSLASFVFGVHFRISLRPPALRDGTLTCLSNRRAATRPCRDFHKIGGTNHNDPIVFVEPVQLPTVRSTSF
jgi:hypothetical protein